MLLTRSPLSPRPKPRFSLDLHVLSAPPAFVLSQDQTLREENGRRPRRGRQTCLPSSSKLKRCLPLPEGRVDGFLIPHAAATLHRWNVSTCARARRKRTLLSFQRPVPRANKKPPTRARGPHSIRYSSYPIESKALLGRVQTSYCPFGRQPQCSKGLRSVKRDRRAARNGASPPARAPRRASLERRRARPPAHRRP